MSVLRKAAFLSLGALILGCGERSVPTSPPASQPSATLDDASLRAALKPYRDESGEPEPLNEGTPPFTCIGAFTGTTQGDLIVPPGQFCIIIGATVNGNVLVQPNAIGFHSHNSTIARSVLSPGPIGLDIRILASRVGQNVDIRQTRNGSAGAICRSDIGGSVALLNNAGHMTVGIGFPGDVCTDGNRIHGYVALDQNTGSMTVNTNHVDRSVLITRNVGLIPIFANVIGDALVCLANTPPPLSTGNTARAFVGQCHM